MIIIKEYEDREDRTQAAELWKSIFGYRNARNNPGLAIDKKIDHKDNLFFVAKEKETVLGTIMAGYDGHRGWIYSLAVLPEMRNKGIGSKLLQHAEEKLKRFGCLKVNLQILETNEEVKDFYLKHGYHIEPRISMGKEFTENIPKRSSHE